MLKPPGLRCALVFAAALLAVAAPAAAGDLIHASGFERPAARVGGSNYLWYRIVDCDREPYGVLPNYHRIAPGGSGSVRAIAQQQLAAMRAAGQARLSLGVHFHHGGSSGSLVDSSSAAAVAQTASNLQNLLVDVKAAGFAEVLFRFFPVGAINPSDPGYDTSLVDEYWNLVVALRPALVNAGIAYRIDLMVEGAPRDSNPPLPDPWKYPANSKWSGAVRDLWQRYYGAWGSADTIGFSFLTDANPQRLRYRVRHMRYVYEGHYPPLFGADIYGSVEADTADRFRSLDYAMRREDSNGYLGWRDASWIIAEAFYDDPLAAAELSSAISVSGREVRYLTQWPWDRANLDCGPTPAVNVAPPVDWTAYGGYGF